MRHFLALLVVTAGLLSGAWASYRWARTPDTHEASASDPRNDRGESTYRRCQTRHWRQAMLCE